MKRTIRVLHVIGGGEFGGAEQHILNLLASFPPNEVEAAVACFYDAVFAQKLREAGIPVYPLSRFGRFDIRLWAGLRETIRGYQPDVLHTHGVKANFFGRLAARGLVPCVLTTVHSHLRFDYAHPLVYAVVSAMEKGTRRWNQHYVAVSRSIGDLLKQDGVPQDRVTVIYNGMDLTPYRRHERQEQDRSRLRAEWNLPGDAFVFGTVARFVPVKGLSHLLEAFALLVRREPGRPYRLVLVGDGPERLRLEEQVTALGLGDRVCFTGFRHDIPACLHAFDVFVHSSLYEGLGYTVIEAMASGVPVVATAAGGTTELVLPEVTGLLAEPASAASLAEAMTRMAGDPSLRSGCVEQARQLVEREFAIRRMADRTLDLYRKLLSRSPSCVSP